MRRILLYALSLMLSALMGTTSFASELVYTPINPAFGGNPLNGTYLLGNAQAQNDLKDPNAPVSPYTQRSALDRFTDMLQSRLLSELLTNVSNGQTGSMVTDDFIIEIVDNSGTLEITILDRATGETTYIEVNGLTATP